VQYTHVLLLLALVGWLDSGRSSILAQDITRPSHTLTSEDTTLNPGVPPTPQFLQAEVDIGAGGLGPIRLHYYPPWVALHRPQIRVGEARTAPPPEAETAPPLGGGADQLHHALEQALDRAQPREAPSR
jgi:hypothetical protein